MPCQCEHVEHFDGDKAHAYLDVPAGTTYRAEFVGEICDWCALNHLQEWLVS